MFTAEQAAAGVVCFLLRNDMPFFQKRRVLEKDLQYSIIFRTIYQYVSNRFCINQFPFLVKEINDSR